MANARLEPASAVPSPFLIDTEIADRMVLMGGSALFAGLSSMECARIAGMSRSRFFPRNDVLFMEGQPVRQVLLVKSGSVKMTQLSASGNEVILWLGGCGDAIGLSGHSSPSNHTCSARAIENCTAIVWESSKFETLVEESPRMRRNVNRILSDRLNELEIRFREIATERVARRVAHALVRLLKQVGKPTAGGIEVSLSREELAQMTGTTLFTISRLMSEWEDLDLVSPRREAVLVRDPRRLWEVGDTE